MVSDNTNVPQSDETMKAMGHRLRKPLVTILDACNLLLSGIEGEMDATVRADVEKIHCNAAQALQAMDEVLELYSVAKRSSS